MVLGVLDPATPLQGAGGGRRTQRGRVYTYPRVLLRTEPIHPTRYYGCVTPYTTMKLSVPSLIAILALGSGVATLSSGCAGTATRESTGEYIDDATTTTKVKAAFVKDPLVKALDVKVDTFKGTVHLSGFVDTAEQKTRAEQIAAGVTGVSAVKNNITVKTAATR
jgi:hyperosmotically inducible periplasmic protein